MVNKQVNFTSGGVSIDLFDYRRAIDQNSTDMLGSFSCFNLKICGQDVPHLTVRMTYNTDCNFVKKVCVSRFLRHFLCLRKFAFPDLQHLCCKHCVHLYR